MITACWIASWRGCEIALDKFEFEPISFHITGDLMNLFIDGGSSRFKVLFSATLMVSPLGCAGTGGGELTNGSRFSHGSKACEEAGGTVVKDSVGEYLSCDYIGMPPTSVQNPSLDDSNDAYTYCPERSDDKYADCD